MTPQEEAALAAKFGGKPAEDDAALAAKFGGTPVGGSTEKPIG